MKKLITICLLLATTFTTNAQQKPTKEETLAFMKRTLEATIGYNAPGKGKILEIKFSGDYYFYKAYYDLGDTGFTNYSTTSLINWEKIKPDFIIFKDANSLTEVKISFSNSMKIKQQVSDQPERDFFNSQATFYVSTEKKESFKKACLRLAEIAKEENKDPFEK